MALSEGSKGEPRLFAHADVLNNKRYISSSKNKEVMMVCVLLRGKRALRESGVKKEKREEIECADRTSESRAKLTTDYRA